MLLRGMFVLCRFNCQDKKRTIILAFVNRTFAVIGRDGLNSVLREKGQFTVFAPTNRAFEALNDGMMDKLLQGDTCLNSEYISTNSHKFL